MKDPLKPEAIVYRVQTLKPYRYTYTHKAVTSYDEN